MKLHLRIPYEDNTTLVVSAGKYVGQMFDTAGSFSFARAWNNLTGE